MTRVQPESAALQPHWSARIEDVKNAAVAGLLDTFGWVLRIKPFTGFGTPGRVRVIARVLWARPTAPSDYHDQPVWDMRSMAVRGWRSFLSQVAPHRDVRIELGDSVFLARSDRSGLLDVQLEADLEPGVHIARISTTSENVVTAEVHVHSTEGDFGIVSDIDDTVVVTWLPRPLLAFWNAFVIPQTSRRAVPGMANLYQHVARSSPSAPFVYLSTGAWNVFPVLQRFLYKNGYPDGPLLLTDWGPTNTGFFRSGREHKERTLEQLAREFPDTKWLLIGDDGQHDPAIYAAFARSHPQNVAAVAIRELTESEQVLSSGLRARRHPDLPADSDVVWVQGPNGHALLHALRREDLIP
ncbi:App1 family protein [Brachybacterium endophyticum]|uniref:App1 family protein n=1 Tax=Brachybacterium endophyticum TaxID=2182385 RepID=UPI001F0CC81B|nr:phosphatase domain-containing protein [Brachybacterium endophyticum]